MNPQYANKAFDYVAPSLPVPDMLVLMDAIRRRHLAEHVQTGPEGFWRDAGHGVEQWVVPR